LIIDNKFKFDNRWNDEYMLFFIDEYM